MNKLKMKAKAGVTLIELLVVVLIVTILSVAMLPLLQPFVVESQYAAEAIPVIGNLRTKIGVYQYDKTRLPQHNPNTSTSDDGETTTNPIVETWDYNPEYAGEGDFPDTFRKATFALKGLTKPADGEKFIIKTEYSSSTFDDSGNKIASNEHFGQVLDLSVEDLKGKRSRPSHYEYVVIKNGSDYIYAVGVFGDGNGLKLGTGYAVCEINLPSIGRKYVGTWKRYKPIADVQIHFSNDTTLEDSNDSKSTWCCFLHDDLGKNITAGKDKEGNDDGKEPEVIGLMRDAGWEFN